MKISKKLQIATSQLRIIHSKNNKQKKTIKVIAFKYFGNPFTNMSFSFPMKKTSIYISFPNKLDEL